MTTLYFTTSTAICMLLIFGSSCVAKRYYGDQAENKVILIGLSATLVIMATVLWWFTIPHSPIQPYLLTTAIALSLSALSSLVLTQNCRTKRHTLFYSSLLSIVILTTLSGIGAIIWGAQGKHFFALMSLGLLSLIILGISFATITFFVGRPPSKPNGTLEP